MLPVSITLQGNIMRSQVSAGDVASQKYFEAT
jgi:hypothetical protein